MLFIATRDNLRQSGGKCQELGRTQDRYGTTTHHPSIGRILMQTDSLRSIARVGGLPIHPMLVPFPIACFFGAFVTDLVYWWTDNTQWETFSVWLLSAGMVMAGFAVIAGLI